MALRFERRHLPFRTWYHKRYEGGRGSGTAPCCFLLLQGGNFELLQGGCLELLSCQGPVECCLLLAEGGALELAQGGCLETAECSPVPPVANCATLPQPGIVETDVTWDGSLFFNAVDLAGTIFIDSTIDFPLNPLAFGATVDTVTANGEGFSFQLADRASLAGGSAIGFGPVVNVPPIDCGNNGVIHSDGCGWRTAPQFPYFAFTFAAHPTVANIEAGSFSLPNVPFNPDSVFTIIRCADKVCFYIDDDLKASSQVSEPPYANSRLNIFNQGAGSAANFVTNVKFLSNISCG